MTAAPPNMQVLQQVIYWLFALYIIDFGRMKYGCYQPLTSKQLLAITPIISNIQGHNPTGPQKSFGIQIGRQYLANIVIGNHNEEFETFPFDFEN